MDIVIDVQGFRGNNGEFICKELAYVDLNETEPVSTLIIFKPPFAWSNLSDVAKRTNLWLQNHYHGLDWDSGTVPYEKVPQILQSIKDLAAGEPLLIVWVKGIQKKRWLQPYFECIRNLEDIGCPSLKSTNFLRHLTCSNHPPGWQKNCAVQNSAALYRWVECLEENYNLDVWSDDSGIESD